VNGIPTVKGKSPNSPSLQGEYDFMAISETNDEIAAAAFNLNTAKQGNVHTLTLRAFTVAEMEKILDKVA
jgi:uncharacterized protein with GYD domain